MLGKMNTGDGNQGFEVRNGDQHLAQEIEVLNTLQQGKLGDAQVKRTLMKESQNDKNRVAIISSNDDVRVHQVQDRSNDNVRVPRGRDSLNNCIIVPQIINHLNDDVKGDSSKDSHGEDFKVMVMPLKEISMQEVRVDPCHEKEKDKEKGKNEKEKKKEKVPETEECISLNKKKREKGKKKKKKQKFEDKLFINSTSENNETEVRETPSHTSHANKRDEGEEKTPFGTLIVGAEEAEELTMLSEELLTSSPGDMSLATKLSSGYRWFAGNKYLQVTHEMMGNLQCTDQIASVALTNITDNLNFMGKTDTNLRRISQFIQNVVQMLFVHSPSVGNDNQKFPFSNSITMQAKKNILVSTLIFMDKTENGFTHGRPDSMLHHPCYTSRMATCMPYSGPDSTSLVPDHKDQVSDKVFQILGTTLHDAKEEKYHTVYSHFTTASDKVFQTLEPNQVNGEYELALRVVDNVNSSSLHSFPIPVDNTWLTVLGDVTAGSFKIPDETFLCEVSKPLAADQLVLYADEREKRLSLVNQVKLTSQMYWSSAITPVDEVFRVPSVCTGLESCDASCLGKEQNRNWDPGGPLFPLETIHTCR